MVSLLAASVGAFSGFFLLLSVVPLYAVENGATSAGAGSVTGVLMLSTVATQVAMPWLLGKLGYRPALVAGLVLLGAPTLLLVWASGLGAILAVSLLRGVGFGFVTVIGSALVAELVAAERRGTGIGLYGLSVGVPNLFALPLGVWLAANAGYDPVLLAGAVAPLLGLPAVLLVSAPHPADAGAAGTGILSGILQGGLMRPFAILFSASLASGVIVTFLPLAVSAGAVASAALLALGAGATTARWLAGVLGDRFGSRRLLAPGVLAAATGVLAPAGTDNALLLAAGMVLFGIGFGTLQNATLVLMFGRAGRTSVGSASALWNIAFDAGTGLGAATLGVVVQYAGFGAAFAATSAVVFAAMVLVLIDRNRRDKEAP